MTAQNAKFIMNHFRMHWLLTRKDQLAMNVRLHVQELIQRKSPLVEEYKTIPHTFIFPQEKELFNNYTGHQSSPNAKWIVKPASLCQGQGIFITDKDGVIEWFNSSVYAEIVAKRHTKDTELVKMMLKYYQKYGVEQNFDQLDKQYESGHDLFLVQKYIENPLLINNHKFDCRIFVLVTSFRPNLVAYISNEGFARFALKEYSGDDLAAHLTNIAIQKGDSSYDNKSDGAKWNLQKLMSHIQLMRGKTAAHKCWSDIRRCIFRCLECVQDKMDANENCFALYGFDVMLTDDLHPFICEVNASPSMVPDTTEDDIIKKRVLNDVLSIVVDKVSAHNGFGVFSRLQYASERNPCEGGNSIDLFKEWRLLKIQ